MSDASDYFCKAPHPTTDRYCCLRKGHGGPHAWMPAEIWLDDPPIPPTNHKQSDCTDPAKADGGEG